MRLTARKIQQDAYPEFEQLNGIHPWMKTQPEGYVPYRVRELRQGTVAYFNYALAKEMGLIAVNHPHHMTVELENTLLSTFSLQIINEYDELTNKKIDPSTIKPNKYMASRYLQLQHTNKQGKTSGDGRGIWNGVVEHRGKIWDVSSRGTGVTCLAPGAVEANKPLRTGGTEFGYGCGLAEIDELYGASIFAEIMHLQGINTERVLCIIDLGKGYGIGVRAGLNLLRPAHLFLYLKQNRLEDLKRGMDYFVERQIKNKSLQLKSRGNRKYEELAEVICHSFADFTAKLDIDYIFAWLDWDGDNVLADAGIIDYGSVRQFGIRHDEYRYDDVERFSTNLNEQRAKAKLIVQVFIQISDYLQTGKKKSLREYARHPIALKFDKKFAQARSERLLYRMGFNSIQRQNILKNPSLFEQFDREFSYFERAKVSGNPAKVADGVNHPALFNMRKIFKTLPALYLKNGFENFNMNKEEFFKTILSSFAKTRDARMGNKHSQHIENFQNLYKQMIRAASPKQKPQMILSGVCSRAQKLNQEDRLTGNALIQIVNELITARKRGATHTQIQETIDQLIARSLDIPEAAPSKYHYSGPRALSRPDLISKITNLALEYGEDI